MALPLSTVQFALAQEDLTLATSPTFHPCLGGRKSMAWGVKIKIKIKVVGKANEINKINKIKARPKIQMFGNRNQEYYFWNIRLRVLDRRWGMQNEEIWRFEKKNYFYLKFFICPMLLFVLSIDYTLF